MTPTRPVHLQRELAAARVCAYCRLAEVEAVAWMWQVLRGHAKQPFGSVVWFAARRCKQATGDQHAWGCAAGLALL